MRRKNKVRAFGNKQVFFEINSKICNYIAFFFKNSGIQNYTVANKIGCISMKNTRRNLVQHYFFIPYVQCMSCIGTSLESCNYVVIFSEKINDLTFSFIAPLEAE